MMRIFLYLCILVAGASCRPQFPEGYNYPLPSSMPASFAPNLLPIQSFSTQYEQPSSESIGNQDGPTFQDIGVSGIENEIPLSSQNPPIQFEQSSLAPLPEIQEVPTFENVKTEFRGNEGNFGTIEAEQSGNVGPGYSNSGSYYESAPIIHKHVYVYSAPDEPEIRTQKQVVVGAPQKHYKIIFIKAPSQLQLSSSLTSIQPPSEEKTIVYVLVKKPEEIEEINIPTPAPYKATKPEVYFIKYKTKKEEVSTNVLDKSSVNNIPSTLTNEQSFDLGIPDVNDEGQSFNPSVDQGDELGGQSDEFQSVGQSNVVDNNPEGNYAVDIGSSTQIPPKYGPPQYIN